MEYSYLKFEQPEEAVGLLKISVPKSLNALNSGVLKEFSAFLDEVGGMRLKVLLITGDGEKSFVAGADIAEMQQMSEAEALDFARLGAAVFKRIEDLPIPVIAVVNGFALGGGCELAMACDLRIASERARFGQPEVGLGIIPGFSGTHRLTKIVGSAFAKELIFTGKSILAPEALRIGLVNAVFPPEQLMEEALALAGKIKSNSAMAVSQAKHCINQNFDLTVEEALALENQCFASCFAHPDQKEGMTAFLEKRKPLFEGR